MLIFYKGIIFFYNTQVLFNLFYIYNKLLTMYKTLISPKVYTKETDLTYRTPKPIKKNRSSKSSGGITPTPVETFYLLLENGFYLLTEDNNKIKL